MVRNSERRILSIFRDRGGILRTSEAMSLGISSRELYRLRDRGLIEALSRGLYRLTELPPLTNPDLVTIARRIPRGVVCLVSALAFHELTDQIPHLVHIALPRGCGPPRLEHPPIRTYWFSGAAYDSCIEEHLVDGVLIRVYSAEKTLADCFKYRNRLGLDIALEGLREYLRRRRVDIEALLQAARVCRVEKVLRPYVEALL